MFIKTLLYSYSYLVCYFFTHTMLINKHNFTHQFINHDLHAHHALLTVCIAKDLIYHGFLLIETKLHIYQYFKFILLKLQYYF